MDYYHHQTTLDKETTNMIIRVTMMPGGHLKIDPCHPQPSMGKLVLTGFTVINLRSRLMTVAINRPKATPSTGPKISIGRTRAMKITIKWPSRTYNNRGLATDHQHHKWCSITGPRGPNTTPSLCTMDPLCRQAIKCPRVRQWDLGSKVCQHSTGPTLPLMRITWSGLLQDTQSQKCAQKITTMIIAPRAPHNPHLAMTKFITPETWVFALHRQAQITNSSSPARDRKACPQGHQDQYPHSVPAPQGLKWATLNK
jgi:hypothetical protein